MKGAIGLVDYGMGNLHSVQRAFERLGAEVRAVRSPEAIDACQALVLPGVGAFDPAMERLRAADLVEPLRHSCAAGRPLLGICLGLQLLFEGRCCRRAAPRTGSISSIPTLRSRPIPP
jgi:glutamine amidotransferase